jgi:hypothetical protein
MRGIGEFANLIEKRFELACRRFGLNGAKEPDERSRVRAHDGLDTSRFKPPRDTAQLDLFS